MGKNIDRKLQSFVSCLLLFFLVHSASAQVPGTAESEIIPDSHDCCPIGAFAAEELVVSFQPETTLDRVEEIAAELGTSIIMSLGISFGPVYLMGVPVGQELALIPFFEAFPEVSNASTNLIACIPESLPCECCPSGLICPPLPPCLSLLIISPPSGDYVTTQHFDLTLIVEAPGLSVVGGSATLDGFDVTSDLASCNISGTLVSGGQTLRCPGLTGGSFGTGTHTLSVTLDLSDGSSVSDSVNWEVKENIEP